MKETLTTKLNAKRWATYSAAGVAALAAGADTAEADITFVPDVNTFITNNTTSSFASGTLGPSVIFSFINDNAPDDGPVFLSIFDDDNELVGSVVGFTDGGVEYINNLSSGVNLAALSNEAFLSANSFFVASGFDGENSQSQFVNASGFIGFRFDVGNGDGFQYGWFELTAAGDAPVNSFTLERYAFGTAGQAVSTGQTTAVPEPSSLSLLALGAVGVLSTRRRRRESVAS